MFRITRCEYNGTSIETAIIMTDVIRISITLEKTRETAAIHTNIYYIHPSFRGSNYLCVNGDTVSSRAVFALGNGYYYLWGEEDWGNTNTDNTNVNIMSSDRFFSRAVAALDEFSRNFKINDSIPEGNVNKEGW